jgi:hypothetical protein
VRLEQLRSEQGWMMHGNERREFEEQPHETIEEYERR